MRYIFCLKRLNQARLLRVLAFALCWPLVASAQFNVTSCRPATSEYAKFDAATGLLHIPVLSINGAATPLYSITARLSNEGTFDILEILPHLTAISPCVTLYNSANGRLILHGVEIPNIGWFSVNFQVNITASQASLQLIEATPLPTFSGLTHALPQTAHTALVAWDTASSSTTPTDEITYEIYAGETPDFPLDLSTLKIRIAGRRQFLLENLTPATTYFIKTVAVDLSGYTSPALSIQRLEMPPATQTIQRNNVMPSFGRGGDILAGQAGASNLGASIFVPASYKPTQLASPVIWLFNEATEEWAGATAEDAAIIVNLNEYNNISTLSTRLSETRQLLEAEYNVDMGRYYWAGWSAGGNIAIILGAANQNQLAGIMVFPGTGGNLAKPNMETHSGHKMRLYYACGELDQQFNCGNVQFEAQAWQAWYGYETHFASIAGAPHKIIEATYQARADAWRWMSGFNLLN